MNKKVQIFGDSHARYFEINDKLYFHAPWLKNYDISVLKLPASSLIGLGRKRSSLGNNEKIKNELISKSCAVFCFGQVDIELGYYFRKVVKNEAITDNEFIDMLCDSYSKFINDLNHDGTIVIKGINLTVLKYDNFAFSYIKRIITENEDDKRVIRDCEVKLRQEIKNFSFRNRFNIKFNDRLRKLCKENGWSYFDINSYLSGFNMGKGVLDNYIPCGFDHHLIDSIEMRKLHLTSIKDIVDAHY